MCVVFFFKGYGDHRDLHVLTHSFPTRRSSDLLATHREAVDEDDRVLAHTCWNGLVAWAEWQSTRPSSHPIPQGRRYFPNAGLLVDRRAGRTLCVALGKGGVFRHFSPDGQVTADTGPSVLTTDGRNAVAHLQDRYEVEIEEDRIVVGGSRSEEHPSELPS